MSTYLKNNFNIPNKEKINIPSNIKERLPQNDKVNILSNKIEHKSTYSSDINIPSEKNCRLTKNCY